MGDGKLLAAGCADGRLQLWDVAASKLRLEVPKAHAGPVLALDFSWHSTEAPGAPLLFSSGADGKVNLRQTAEGRLQKDTADSSFSSGRLPPLAVFDSGAGCPGPVTVVGGRFTLANLLLVAGIV